MKNEFGDLQLPALIELLAIYTRKYTHMMKVGGLENKLKVFEELVLQLHNEIQTRKTQEDLDSNPEIFPVLA
jgi:hypothetical protein